MPPSLADATIVFDLDGTLIDTAPDLIRALNRVLDTEGLPRPPPATARSFVGHGARVLIERTCGMAGVQFSEDKLDALTSAYVEAYAADIAAESRPFPGALAALAALEQAGCRLAICTNKRTGLSLQLLDALGLTHRFAAVVGSDAVAERKPHPEHLLTTIARAGGAADRALFVGDTAVDAETGRAANVPTVLVRFGYGARIDELASAAIIDHFDDLPPAAHALLGVLARQG